MQKLFVAVCLSISSQLFVAGSVAQANLTCEPTAETYAVRILGTNPSGELTNQYFPKISGDDSFYQTLENGWVFSLQKAEAGWSIRVYEDTPVSDATDLTSLTPPHTGAPNPRDIYGWHFRNAANTGKNTGDVNAPQDLRAFVISPALQGTGGYRPSGDPASQRHQAPNPADGIGWLKIMDYGLAGLDPGQKARMNYMQFDACISWPRNKENKAAYLDARSYTYTPAEHEAFGSCGLDLNKITLDATYLPRTLGGDIDGDGAIDEVAQIQNEGDKTRGLALCRAGTWMHVIDGKSEDDNIGLTTNYIKQTEAWHWITLGSPRPITLGDFEFPEADGDYLILERIEKQAIAVYSKDGELRSKELYHIVTE